MTATITEPTWDVTADDGRCVASVQGGRCDRERSWQVAFRSECGASGIRMLCDGHKRTALSGRLLCSTHDHQVDVDTRRGRSPWVPSRSSRIAQPPQGVTMPAIATFAEVLDRTIADQAQEILDRWYPQVPR